MSIGAFLMKLSLIITPFIDSPSFSVHGVIISSENNFSSQTDGYDRREVDEKITNLDNKIYKLEQRIELLERKLDISPQSDSSATGVMGW